MSELGQIRLHRMRETIYFGHYEKTRVANGNVARKFQTDFTRKAARYRISQRMILSNQGLDWQDNNVFAVRHLNNKRYEKYVAFWRGQVYKISNVVVDDTKIMTYDLVSLRRSDENK